MQLAADPISIEIAGDAYELRPTLQAATRLARRHGDFAKVYRAVLADHFSTIADVIREGTGSDEAEAFFVASTEAPRLREQLDRLKLPLLRFILALAGHDSSDPEPTAPESRPISFAEYHAQLYRIGTGWLGWTPEQTWNATPAEIIEARAGRTEMIEGVLKAVFGGTTEHPADHYTAERLAQVVSTGADPTFDRAAFEKLRQLKSVAHA